MEILFFLFIAYFIYLNFSSSSDRIDYNPSIDYKIDDGHFEEKKRLAEKNSSFFDNLLEYPLSQEQRLAIVDYAKRVLVIASAGSGKTSILISKYAYLVKKLNIKEDEILILAFNKGVKAEIKNSLKKLKFSNSQMHTFHSFGMEVMAENLAKTSLDKYADEDKEGILATQLINLLIERSEHHNKLIRNKIIEFKSICPVGEIWDFAETEEEYKQMIASFPYKRDFFKNRDSERPLRIPAIDGVTFVRSQEELAIMNYCIINGIKIEYEKNLEGAGFEYTPDFYFPDIDMWLEHFAINRDGISPFENYVQEYENKKTLHEEMGTNHFFTYSYEYREGNILEKISKKLKSHGIKFKPLSEKQIELRLSKLYADPFNKLLERTLRLAKSNQLSKHEIIQLYDSQSDQLRARMFKEIFIEIYQEYEKYLEENNTHDFEDMILKSTNFLKEDLDNKYKKLKYILVDEFQDISVSRKNLINSILSLNSDMKLFGVGDDWQSIYRFTGSDITSITNFENNFPIKESDVDEDSCVSSPEQDNDSNKEVSLKNIEPSWRDLADKEKDLERKLHLPNESFQKNYSINKIKYSHRFENSIATLSSNFIMKNPNQIQKNISGRPSSIALPANFCWVEDYSTNSIIDILNQIPKAKNDNKQSIFVLARANYQLKNIDFRKLSSYREDIVIKKDRVKSTIHSAKGLEEDIVIILGLDSGPRGFPMWWGEDPLASVFLPIEDKYRFSEERRVMYVAMTRTKGANYFVYEQNGPSAFVDEIISLCKQENIPMKEFNFKKKIIKQCPDCKIHGRPGSLIIKTKNPKNAKGNKNKFSVYLGCNMYNPKYNKSELYCDKTESDAPCPKCLRNGNNSILRVSFNDTAPKVRIACSICNFYDNYYNYHKNL